MIKAFIDAGMMFVKKPGVLIATLIVGLLELFVLFLVYDDFIAGFLYELLILGKAPQTGLLEYPFHLFLFYPIDLIVISISFFIMLALMFYLVFVLSEMVKGKDENFISAMVKSLVRIGDIIVLTLAAMVAGFLALVVLYITSIIILALGPIGAILLLIAPLIWVIVMLYLFLKFSFTPYVMGIKDLKLKPAMKEVWKWSGKHLLGIVLALLLATIISSIINSVGIFIGDLIADEFLGFIPIYLFTLLSTSYSMVALSLFYSSSQ